MVPENSLVSVTDIIFDKLADSLATKTVAECGPAARQRRSNGSKSKKRKANRDSAGSVNAQSISKKARVENAEGAEDIRELSPAPVALGSVAALKTKVQDTFVIYVLYWQSIPSAEIWDEKPDISFLWEY